MFQSFNLKFTSPLNSLVSVLLLMLPLFGIHSLKTFVHHPLLPLLERNSKPISTQMLILLSSFSLMAAPWCRPISVPGFLILHIAIVLLHLRVHNSVEIKRYKSQIRIRIYTSFYCITTVTLKNNRTNLSTNVKLVRYQNGEEE